MSLDGEAERWKWFTCRTAKALECFYTRESNMKDFANYWQSGACRVPTVFQALCCPFSLTGGLGVGRGRWQASRQMQGREPLTVVRAETSRAGKVCLLVEPHDFFQWTDQGMTEFSKRIQTIWCISGQRVNKTAPYFKSSNQFEAQLRRSRN